MMSAKMVAPALLKVKVFWDKGYNAIYSVYDVTKKFCHMNQIILWIWSCGRILVTLAFV